MKTTPATISYISISPVVLQLFLFAFFQLADLPQVSLAVTRVAVTGRKVEQNYVPEPYTAEEWDIDYAYDVTGTIEFVTTQTNYAPSVRWYDSRGRFKDCSYDSNWE